MILSNKVMFSFFVNCSYQTCSLMKYMDRYKIKSDTKAFHLVGWKLKNQRTILELIFIILF